jgi:hypothetical protein
LAEPDSAFAVDAHDFDRNTVSRDVDADVPLAVTLKLCPGLTDVGTLSLTEYGVAASAAAQRAPLAAIAAAAESRCRFIIILIGNPGR